MYGMMLSTSEVCFRQDYNVKTKNLLSEIKQRSDNLRDGVIQGSFSTYLQQLQSKSTACPGLFSLRGYELGRLYRIVKVPSFWSKTRKLSR